MAVTAPPDAAGAIPPHNEEAEASVLGAILLTEQALDGVLLEVGLKPDDFYRPRHQMIFRAMIRLKEKAEPEAVDVVTVCDELRRDSELEKVGGDSYVHSLPTIAPAPGAFLHHARIVKQHSLLRRVLITSREMQDQVLGHRGEARELIERFEAQLFRISHEDGRGEMRSLEDVLHEEIDKLEELSRSDVGLTGTPSGFTDLDNLTGGFQPGNLIVLAARPSMGKSTVATNIAENAAIDHERPVALFSLEMSETELAHRFIASQARVSSDELRKGRVKADRWPKVLKAVEKLARAPIFVDDSSDIGVLEIRAKARRLHARKELGLIVVDYLQLVRADGRADSRVEQVGQISRGLKILARELNIPVIAVSQLSRAVESRHPPIPMLSDLRESGQVEQDADVVMFVYRDEYYSKDQTERPGEADIIIAKHRNGPVDTISLAFQPRFPKFSNLYRERGGSLSGGGPPERASAGNGGAGPDRGGDSAAERDDDPVFGGGSDFDAGPADDDARPDVNDPWNGGG